MALTPLTRSFAPALVFASLGLFAACAGEPTPGAPPAPPPSAVSASSSTGEVASAPAADSAATPPSAPLPPVEFAEGAPAAAPDKAPSMKIMQPTNEQIIAPDKAGDFEVKLDLKGWETAVGANHVHLILDNRPYKRIDDPKQPIKLKDIDPNYTIGEGQHVLVAFPSRATHESVKPVGKASPLAVVSFYVGKKGEVKWKATDPTLIYSRPKGANNGAPPSEGLLVDWYLANVELGDGKFTIDATLTGPGLESGKTVTIKDWKPWRIKNPRSGTYSLQMVLKGKTESLSLERGTTPNVSSRLTSLRRPCGGHAGHAGHGAAHPRRVARQHPPTRRIESIEELRVAKVAGEVGLSHGGQHARRKCSWHSPRCSSGCSPISFALGGLVSRGRIPAHLSGSLSSYSRRARCFLSRFLPRRLAALLVRGRARVSTVAAIVSTALLVHFGVRYASSPRSRSR
ncbi:MAG: hypothetical protein U0165_05760 [Polyangiaceae bacterium]